jgi:cytoskeletal protein RodZ
MLKQFSEELKEKRELKGISIEQLAAKSRIDIKYLKLMEDGNFSFLPEVYVKAFLRDYAKMVGLDQNIILKKFDAAQKGLTYDEKGETGKADTIDAQQDNNEIKNDAAKAASVHSYVEPGVSGAPASTPSKSNNNMVTIGVVAAAVVVIFSLIYFFFLRGGNEIVVEEKPLSQVIQENQKRYEEKTNSSNKQNESAISSTDSLNLLIKTSDTCWVRIFLDDSIADEYTFFPNSQKMLRADRNFKLIIGNSGVIQFELDNKPLNFSGKRGAVSYLQIDSSGIKNLPAQPELNNPQ